MPDVPQLLTQFWICAGFHLSKPPLQTISKTKPIMGPVPSLLPSQDPLRIGESPYLLTPC